MPEDFILNPSALVLQELNSEHWHELVREGYRVGRLTMALEILTVIKILESTPAATMTSRQETVVTLETLLRDTGQLRDAEEAYRKLSEIRRLKFKPTVVPSSEPPGSASAGEVYEPRGPVLDVRPSSPLGRGPQRRDTPS